MQLSKRNKAKLVAFDQWSALFATLEPELSGHVRCPICWCEFQRSSVNNGDLTREHVIPSAAKKLTKEPQVTGMTCKTCNNRAGAWGQAATRDVIESKLFLSGVYPGPVNALVSLDKLPQQQVELTIDANKNISLVGIPKQNDKRLVRKITNHLEMLVESKSEDWGFELEGELNGLTARARYGFLYSAYLLAFHQTDGKYGYTVAGQSVRELLNSEPDELFPQCVIDISVPKLGMTPWHAIVNYEAMAKSIWASILGMIVMLPFDTDSDMECYKILAERGKESHFGMTPPASKYRMTIRGIEQLRTVLQNLPTPMNVGKKKYEHS